MAHEFHAIKYLDKKGNVVRVWAYNEALAQCERIAKEDVRENSTYQYYIITPISEQEFLKTVLTSKEFKELTTV